MSAADTFIDTNVLLYLVSEDAAKADKAEAVLRGGGTVSVQVLNEFVAVARRKTRLALADIRAILAVVRELCEVVPIDVETHDLALAVCERFGLSIYDATIVAAASRIGARTLLTEDLQSGQVMAGVTIVNPFAA